LIVQIDLDPWGGQTMTTSKGNTVSLSAKELVSGDRDLMKSLMKEGKRSTNPILPGLFTP
jgi:hypothetical protein